MVWKGRAGEVLQPEQVGVRLTWALARVRSLREVAKRAGTGDSESTSSKNGELSFSGVLGSRGHGAEVARLGLERITRSRHSTGREQEKTELGAGRILLEETEKLSLGALLEVQKTPAMSGEG